MSVLPTRIKTDLPRYDTGTGQSHWRTGLRPESLRGEGQRPINRKYNPSAVRSGMATQVNSWHDRPHDGGRQPELGCRGEQGYRVEQGNRVETGQRPDAGSNAEHTHRPDQRPDLGHRLDNRPEHGHRIEQYHGARINNQRVIKTTVGKLNLDCVRPQRAGVILYTVYNDSIYFGLGVDADTHDLTDFGGHVYYKCDHNAVRGALREFQEETLQLFVAPTPEAIANYPVLYDEKNLIIFLHVNADPEQISQRFHIAYQRALVRQQQWQRQRAQRQLAEQMAKAVATAEQGLRAEQGSRTQHIEPTGTQATSGTSQSSPVSSPLPLTKEQKYALNKMENGHPEVCGITWLTWEEFRHCIAERGLLFSRIQKFLYRAGDFSYLL